tara:strand:- start:124 stop:609 length:486 start_codon:yes stop_codon:yes gene_type:complete
MKVYKNFLNVEEFNKIKNVLLDSSFPWFYNSQILRTSKPLGNFQFTHNFYENDLVRSNYFDLLKPVINKINCLSIVRIKANLLTKTDVNIDYGFHTDFNDDKVTTGILYINTNDGYTKFKNGTLEKSKENKYIEFNSKLLHAGSSCTNKNIRVVLNLNYIK